MTLEAENASLRKEIQSLYGKLGSQGYKQTLEKKYRDLQAQLYEAYNQIEALEKERRDLRDDFAGMAMQGLISNKDALLVAITAHSNTPQKIGVAIEAYGFADEMMKERGKGE